MPGEGVKKKGKKGEEKEKKKKKTGDGWLNGNRPPVNRRDARWERRKESPPRFRL